jgi:hypothetical protein
MTDELSVAFDGLVAEYVAGGLEPDGVGLAMGDRVTALGYGSDLSCTEDADEFMTEIDPLSVQAIGEALARRLMTSHGRIIDDPEMLTAVGEDPDYGYDISRLLSVPIDSLEARAHQDLASAECLKDDRIDACAVAMQLNGASLSVVISARVRDTGETFDHVLALTPDSVGAAS